MDWLVKLVTPPGGTVLDPFAGSGTTLLAADRLGLDAIGIEQSAEYVADIHRRLAADAPLFAEPASTKLADDGQQSLFAEVAA
jgi:site-specific DNA-methyltransferase (adenine-specific)